MNGRAKDKLDDTLLAFMVAVGVMFVLVMTLMVWRFPW